MHLNGHLNNPRVAVEPKKNQGQLAGSLGHPLNVASFSSAGQGWQLSWKQGALHESASRRERFCWETRDLPGAMSWFSQALYAYFVVFTLSEERAIKVPKPHWPPVTPYHHFIRLTPSPPGGLPEARRLAAFSAKFCLVLITSVFREAKISPCLGDRNSHTPACTLILWCFWRLRACVGHSQRASFILERLTRDLKFYHWTGDGPAARDISQSRS